MDSFLGEKSIISLGYFGDLTGGVSTVRIDASKSDRIAFVIYVASAAADMDFTLKQHDAAAAGTSKDLIALNPYFVKVGAATEFTKKELVAANTVDADFNGAAGYLVVEVLGEDLDRDNGFDYVSLDIALGLVARNAHISVEGHLPRNKPAYLQGM